MAQSACAQAEEEAPPHKDTTQHNDEEDSFAPPNEVAPDPPTGDWFWGQYNLALWKAMPPTERARKVEFKKDWAEQNVKNLAAWNACRDALKRRSSSFGGKRVDKRTRCTKTTRTMQ
ncbi:Actin-related protein 2 [Hordeum vulgare]|nr:Actin-related protein 2 [Hordeum vulgare]